MKIERRDRSSLPDAHPVETWEASENGKRYRITVRRSPYGPSWAASVFVEPKSDQKPYWRPLRNWQKFACAVREFENRN